MKKVKIKTFTNGPEEESPQDGKQNLPEGDGDNRPSPESFERFYNLLEGFQKLYFYKRRVDGEFTFVGSRVKSILGYSPEEFKANWKNYLADNLRNEGPMCRFKQGLQATQPESLAVEFFHKDDGRRLWLEIFESPVLGPDGQLLEVEGIACDITQRKIDEDAVRSSETRYREISESSPIGIFQVDPDDNYIYVNTCWQMITELTLKEILGTIWWQVIHPEDQEEVFLNWTKAEEEEREFFTECRITRPSKEIRWVVLRTKFFFHDLGKFTFGTVEDITERKKSEEKLKHFADELQRSNKALDDFAAIASHDLQEPLRKVIAFAERIKKDYSPLLDDRGKDYLGRMEKATMRMQTFIEDLLEFSRITTKAKPFESINLKNLASDALHNLEARIMQTGGRVELENLPTLEVDPFQMRQLFQNLIGNALKFHKPGENPEVKVSASKDPQQGTWQITVKDNGIGFDEKYLERIFKPFERLHGRSEYEGSGIGLAICQKVASRHRGKFTAKSAPGEGACFILTIPEKQRD